MDNLHYKVFLVVFFITYFIVLSSGTCMGDEEVLCKSDKANLQCLHNNFDMLYSKNYNQFWDILHSAEKKAKACDSLSDTAEFIELGSIERGNAEFSEFFNEVIEKSLISQSQCFMDAMLLVDREARIGVINALVYPIFTEPTEIRSIFEQYAGNKKYKDITVIYFRCLDQRRGQLCK